MHAAAVFTLALVALASGQVDDETCDAQKEAKHECFGAAVKEALGSTVGKRESMKIVGECMEENDCEVPRWMKSGSGSSSGSGGSSSEEGDDEDGESSSSSSSSSGSHGGRSGGGPRQCLEDKLGVDVKAEVKACMEGKGFSKPGGHRGGKSGGGKRGGRGHHGKGKGKGKRGGHKKDGEMKEPAEMVAEKCGEDNAAGAFACIKDRTGLDFETLTHADIKAAVCGAKEQCADEFSQECHDMYKQKRAARHKAKCECVNALGLDKAAAEAAMEECKPRRGGRSSSEEEGDEDGDDMEGGPPARVKRGGGGRHGRGGRKGGPKCLELIGADCENLPEPDFGGKHKKMEEWCKAA